MSEKYVLVCVFKPNLTDSQVDPFLEKIDKKISSSGGTVIKSSKLGLRKMATLMRKFKTFKEGLFCEVSFEGPSSLPDEINSLIRVNEDIMRHILTRLPEEPKAVEEKETESTVEINPEMLIGKPE